MFVVIPRRSRMSFLGGCSGISSSAPACGMELSHGVTQDDVQSYSQVAARRRSSRAGFVLEPFEDSTEVVRGCELLAVSQLTLDRGLKRHRTFNSNVVAYLFILRLNNVYSNRYNIQAIVLYSSLNINSDIDTGGAPFSRKFTN